jgi:phospholipase D1/2
MSTTFSAKAGSLERLKVRMRCYDQKSQQPILRAGLTCWRVENSSRFSVLVDGEAYFHAMKAAMEKAKRSILLLGWDFDPLVCLEPDCADGSAEPLFRLMERLIERNTNLRIHILIWDMAWIFALQRRDAPQHARKWLSNDRLAYRLDNQHPTGAAHHQKVLVVDYTIAFCGGSDFTRNRWDTPEHQPADRRRRTRDGRLYGPRHDVVMAVDGAAAAALGDLFREHWRRAGGLAILPLSTRTEVWPDDLATDATDIAVGLARTEPGCERPPRGSRGRGTQSARDRRCQALDLHRKSIFHLTSDRSCPRPAPG